MPINKSESIAGQRRALRAARSNQRKQMRNYFTREGFNKGLTPYRGVKREEETKNDLSNVGETSYKRIIKRENDTRDYYLSARNIVGRVFANSDVGKQIAELEKQTAIARYKICQMLKRDGLTETLAFYSKQWGYIV